MTTSPQKHHLDRRAGRLVAEGADGDPNDLLTTDQLAEWFACSKQWVEIGRTRGYGPKFIRTGPRAIRYRRQDVLSWLEARTYARTAEYAAQKAATDKGETE